MRGTLLVLVAATLVGLPLAAQEAPLGEIDADLTQLAHLLDVVEAEHRASLDPGDVWGRAAQLGHDSDRLSAFVRDEIAYEPYEGLLRGAAGTLAAGAGNALDQALLLQALLAAGGSDSRVMVRDLDAAEQVRLVTAFAARAHVPHDPPPQVERAAHALGVPADLVDAVVRERQLQQAALREEVLAGSLRSAAQLESLLAEHLPSSPVTPPLRHYWLDIEGTAFDPSASGLPLEDGRAVTEAELAAAATSVTIRVVLERLTAGEVASEELLEVTLPAHASAYRPIDLLVYPAAEELPDPLVFMAMSPAERAAALRAVDTFHTALLIDGRRSAGLTFDLEGTVQQVGGEPRVAAATAVGGAMGGLFGRAVGGGTPPSSELHALRLEVVVHTGDGAPRLHTRALYRAGDGSYPMLRDSFLIDTYVHPAGETARRSLTALASNADALRWILFGTGSDRAIEPEADVAPLLLSYADARRQLFATLELAPLYQGVGIVRESRQLLLPPDDTQHGMRHTIDLMDARYAFVAPDGSYDHAAALRAGAAETALEWLLLVRTNPAGAYLDASAWTLIERARALGDGVSVATDGDQLHVAWADDAYWSVDASSALAIGRVPGGAGQAMVEYAWTVSEKICEAMNHFFPLLKELEVEGRALSELETLCSVRGVISKVGTGVDFLNAEDRVAFVDQQLKEWGMDQVANATDIQGALFDAIQGQTRALWRGAAGALAGM